LVLENIRGEGKNMKKGEIKEEKKRKDKGKTKFQR
jgi:hypothetical protein